jgi:CRP/FNR family transcriptional regulator, anaerobic regulatory protein
MIGVDQRPQRALQENAMLAADQIRQIDASFPVLRQLTAGDRLKIFAAGQVSSLPRDQLLLQLNQQCLYIPLVMSGVLRVYKLSPNGREMTLYRIGPGETCLISVACQIQGEDFPALAQVEEDAQLLMLPAALYREVLEPLPAWKDFMIQSMYKHLTGVMQTLEAVAFDRTDKRLILWLLEKSKGRAGLVDCTHEGIAVELGTAREVVSRLLGELKGKGMVRLGRGKIEVVEPARMKDLLEDS